MLLLFVYCSLYLSFLQKVAVTVGDLHHTEVLAKRQHKKTRWSKLIEQNKRSILLAGLYCVYLRKMQFRTILLFTGI